MAHIQFESNEDDASDSGDKWLRENQGETSGLVNFRNSDGESEVAEVPPGLWGSGKLRRRKPMDFFIHLFPEDLFDEIVHNTNPCALQNVEES